MNCSKLKLSTLTAVAVALVAGTAASNSVAGDAYVASSTSTADAGFYFDGFGGILFLDDLSGTGSARVDAEFDTGWMAGGALGYQLSSALSIEIEGAYGQSDLDALAVNGHHVNGLNGDVGLTQVVANIIYEFSPQSAISPYVGFGIGGGFINADFSYAGNRIDDDDAALYYQFIGGVKIDISSGAKLFVEYRYGTMDDFSLSRGGGTVDFNELNAHQAIVGVEIAF